MATMRAMAVERFGGVEELREMQLDAPLVGPDYVLIRIAAAGVNPVDAAIRSGGLTGAFPHVLPVIPGWDAAGTVEEVGPAVTSVRAGDPVLAYCRKDLVQGGTYAELVAVREVQVARAGNMDLVAAGGLPLAGLTAYQSLHDAAGLHTGETVVVRGASGGVGHFAVQLARAAGARVIAIGSADAESFVRELGADEFVDYRAGDVAGSLRRLAPDGVDAFVDMAGGDLAGFVPAMRDGGRMASILVTQAPEEATARDIAFRYVFVRPDAHQLTEMVALADSGRLRVEVDRTYPLAEAGAAQARLAEGGVRGKLILEV
jgi:NADPH:quinone reductase-like Zn-dependent oxidoreductase